MISYRPETVDKAALAGHMRGKLEVFSPNGDIKSSSGWSAWKVGNRNWGRLLAGMFDSTGGTTSRTLTSKAGVDRTITIRSVSGSFNSWEISGVAPVQTHGRLGWGSGAGVPARTDNDISTREAIFNVSSVTEDETNGITSFAGADVWAGANTTATVIGFYTRFPATAGGTAPDDFLLDHTDIADQAVATNDNVAVSYQVAY